MNKRSLEQLMNMFNNKNNNEHTQFQALKFKEKISESALIIRKRNKLDLGEK